MSIPSDIKIVEVGPRDGLQNEKISISSQQKVKLIELLADSGCKNIEVGALVSPKAVPQMANSDEVFQAIAKHKTFSASMLVPNVKGMQKAIELDVKHIAVFTAASNTFNLKNINCTIADSLKNIADILTMAEEHQIKVRAYISCVLGCPYEGSIHSNTVTDLCEKLFAMGCYEISLGDTIGVGTANKARNLFKQASKTIGSQNLAAHFHDTYGQALANCLAVMEEDIHTFDTSVAGLGGCPYAPGASGNLATEDLIYMLHGMGFDTGIDLQKLLTASQYISQLLNRKPTAKVAQAKLAKLK